MYWFIAWFLSKIGFDRMHKVFSKHQEIAETEKMNADVKTVIIEATTKHLPKIYCFDAIFLYNEFKPQKLKS